MNYHGHTIPARREAKLRYLDADFQILKEGDYVRCAITNDPIPVDSLKYWSVDRQEPYKSAAEALLAERRARRAAKA